MGNVLCVPKRNERGESLDEAKDKRGSLFSWISNKFRRRKPGTVEPLPLFNGNCEVQTHASENKVTTNNNEPDVCNHISDTKILQNFYTNADALQPENQLLSSTAKASETPQPEGPLLSGPVKSPSTELTPPPSPPATGPASDSHVSPVTPTAVESTHTNDSDVRTTVIFSQKTPKYSSAESQENVQTSLLETAIEAQPPELDDNVTGTASVIQTPSSSDSVTTTESGHNFPPPNVSPDLLSNHPVMAIECTKVNNEVDIVENEAEMTPQVTILSAGVDSTDSTANTTQELVDISVASSADDTGTSQILETPINKSVNDQDTDVKIPNETPSETVIEQNDMPSAPNTTAPSLAIKDRNLLNKQANIAKTENNVDEIQLDRKLEGTGIEDDSDPNECCDEVTEQPAELCQGDGNTEQNKEHLKTLKINEDSEISDGLNSDESNETELSSKSKSLAELLVVLQTVNTGTEHETEKVKLTSKEQPNSVPDEQVSIEQLTKVIQPKAPTRQTTDTSLGIKGHLTSSNTSASSPDKSSKVSKDSSKRKESITMLNNKPKKTQTTPRARTSFKQNGVPMPGRKQIKQRKVSDFRVPKLPPRLPRTPHILFTKPHTYKIPDVAKDDAQNKITWTQKENQCPLVGEAWATKAPIFQPPIQTVGDRLLDMFGRSVDMMKRSWVIPECRQIETLKLENNIWPGLYIYPHIRWRFNMDLNNRPGIANRRRDLDKPKSSNAAIRTPPTPPLSRPKAKSGGLTRWSRHDSLNSSNSSQEDKH